MIWNQETVSWPLCRSEHSMHMSKVEIASPSSCFCCASVELALVSEAVREPALLAPLCAWPVFPPCLSENSPGPSYVLSASFLWIRVTHKSDWRGKQTLRAGCWDRITHLVMTRQLGEVMSGRRNFFWLTVQGNAAHSGGWLKGLGPWWQEMGR